MNRILVWTIAGVLVVGTAGLIVVNSAQSRVGALIPGDSPVTEDQVRIQLQADGWLDVQIQRDGRIFRVTALKNGRIANIIIDSQTGRLRSDDDDDGDD